MKKLIATITLASFIGLMSVSCSKKEEKKVETPAIAGMQYTCPMHPEVISDAPGTCPKCGMDLVEKEQSAPMDSTTKSVGDSTMKMEADTAMKM